jgi:hypothetical protein
MSGAMTTHLISHRLPGLPGHISLFTDESHALLDAFEEELAASGSGQPFPTAVLMASDFLIGRHGEDGADWAHFELGAFFGFVAFAAPGFLMYAARFKETLVPFLAFLERRGRIEGGMAERASLVPLPHGVPQLEGEVMSQRHSLEEAFEPVNRAERRAMARRLRRAPRARARR